MRINKKKTIFIEKISIFMNFIDIIILLILLFFGYKGFKNGLVKELGSLIALIAGIFLAIRFSDFVASKLPKTESISSEYLPIISFAIILIAVIILVLVFAKLLDQFVKLIKLQWLNRLAGVAFATIKLALILGGLFFLICQLNVKAQIIPNSFFDKSLLYKPIMSIFNFVFRISKSDKYTAKLPVINPPKSR